MVEEEGALYYLNLFWACELLLARTLLPLTGAGFATILIDWVGVELV